MASVLDLASLAPLPMDMLSQGKDVQMMQDAAGTQYLARYGKTQVRRRWSPPAAHALHDEKAAKRPRGAPSGSGGCVGEMGPRSVAWNSFALRNDLPWGVALRWVTLSRGF